LSCGSQRLAAMSDLPQPVLLNVDQHGIDVVMDTNCHEYTDLFAPACNGDGTYWITDAQLRSVLIDITWLPQN
jgi:hypothetical protein